MSKEFSKIYLDIASLLDLRQGVLSLLLGKEHTAKLVTTDDYLLRDLDVFECDMKAYRELIESDDVRVVQASTVTHIPTIIKAKIEQAETRSRFYGINQAPQVIFNTYPYRFTEEQATLIRNALFVKLAAPCEILLVNDAPSHYTPAAIKNLNIVSFFCYDTSAWMSAHAEGLKPGVLQDSLLYFPAIGRQPLEEKETKDIGKLGFKDIFGYTEFILSPALQSRFLPGLFYQNAQAAAPWLAKYEKAAGRTALSSASQESAPDKTEPPKEAP